MKGMSPSSTTSLLRTGRGNETAAVCWISTCDTGYFPPPSSLLSLLLSLLPYFPHHPQNGQRVEYVPKFNSAVAFQVPRLHEVAPMLSDRPRYSVFGWFLRPVAGAEGEIEEELSAEEREEKH